MGGFGGGLGIDFPWLLNGQNGINANTNAGFQNAALTSQIGDIGTQISAGFSGVTAQLSNNQIADLERSFAAQTAQMQGMNAIQSQIANCCCESRLQTANLGADIAREACADRAAVNEALRDVLAANTASTQRILDQMCNDKIDAKNEKIAELQNQLTMAQLTANNNAQTAAILANNEAQTTALEQYLAPVPKPSFIVPNPACCNQNVYGYGCGA